MITVRTLVVAAGGGGDAITGAALAARDGDGPDRPVMTFSWDRLLVDPLPGPRTAADFTGLRPLNLMITEVVAATCPRPPAGSSLPRLAAELPARLLLLDPSEGVPGLGRQIRAVAEYFDAEEILLVDVGGDVLTDGSESGLRSPLADQLALAACCGSEVPTRVLVTGAGLDGELPLDVIADRLAMLDAVALPPLGPADAGVVDHVFTWHPSEASGLAMAAARGRRGVAEVRDRGDLVQLDDTTTAVWTVAAQRLLAVAPARHLTDCSSLADVERAVRDLTGISEIAYETRKAANRERPRPAPEGKEALREVDRHAGAARERGADFISTRRLSELVGARTLQAFEDLTTTLARHRPDRYRRSLYRV